MTVAVGSDGYVDELESGLEDFSLSQGQIPRISIDHNTASWKVSILEGLMFPKLDTILLGLVKTRILWDIKMDDDVKKMPWCKSNGLQKGQTEMLGNPDVVNFPWVVSGFNPDDYINERDGLNNVNLPCGSCGLAQWDSHPTSKAPWCSLMHILPCMLDLRTLVSDPPPFDAEQAEWVPAIFQTSKTGIKPSNAYMAQFRAANKPLYSAMTNLTLRAEQKGGRTYGVPIYTRIGPTDIEDAPAYSANYRMMRDFITAPQDNRTDEQKAAAAAGENALNAAHDADTSVAEAEIVADPVATTSSAPVTPSTAPPAPPAPPTVAPPVVQAPAPPAPAPQVAPVAPTAPAPPISTADEGLPF